MFNQFTFFNKQATSLLNDKAERAIISEGLKSLSNEVAWSAFAIMLNGLDDDKASLVQSVSKEGSLNKCKGMVSKAKKVLTYLNEHTAIEYDNQEVTLESLAAILDDNACPLVTVNGLYNTFKEEVKEESQAAKRDKAIIKEAMHLLNETKEVKAAGIEVTPKQFNLHAKKATFLADAAVIVDARLAAEAKAKGQESREVMFARLVNEIVSNGFQDAILDALTASSEAQEVA